MRVTNAKDAVDCYFETVWKLADVKGALFAQANFMLQKDPNLDVVEFLGEKGSISFKLKMTAKPNSD